MPSLSADLGFPRIGANSRNVSSSVCSYTNSISKLIDWELLNIPILLQRFGHQVALLSSRFLLLCGGFGHLDKRHQRLGGLAYYDVTSKDYHTALISDPLDLLGKRMFHSMTPLSKGSLVVLGGRSSPKNVFNKVVRIQCQNMLFSNTEQLSFTIEQKTDMPLPTWRHSASLLEIEGIENILLFGGSSSENNATDSCYLLNTETWIWSDVSQQPDTPSPRHSHSSVSINKSKVVVSCGLSSNETILNTLHVFDSQHSKWSTLAIPGLLPRYSHTSHFWNNHIFLVGGITSVSGYSLSIGMIHLDSLIAIEFSCPIQDPEYPILLSNHCSYSYGDQIIISGGGGNCFSFGTHFNQRNIRIDLQTLPQLNSRS